MRDDDPYRWKQVEFIGHIIKSLLWLTVLYIYYIKSRSPVTKTQEVDTIKLL
jgi:hypothetical protein